MRYALGEAKAAQRCRGWIFLWETPSYAQTSLSPQMYYLIEQTSQRDDELGAYIVALRGRNLQSGKWLLKTPLERG